MAGLLIQSLFLLVSDACSGYFIYMLLKASHQDFRPNVDFLNSCVVGTERRKVHSLLAEEVAV